jgi:2,4-dienoyl-CoA reductase-like NADH-dependent reductase (Old Yellow Enzyme family)
MFGTPREMAVAEIEEIIEHFASTARLAADAGFAGVQIHGAHGYLLTQFLSPKTNKRVDDYGGSAVKRAKIVVDIIQAVRAAVPSGFCVGIKLNSADFQSVYDMKDFNEQLGAITAAGVDFVEVSGGTYENPEMMANSAVVEKSDRTKAREAFFLEFAKIIRADFPGVPLLVTGGFRTREGMESAVSENDCDMIGLGRPSVLQPSMPKSIILNRGIPDSDAHVYTKEIQTPWYMDIGVKAIGASRQDVSASQLFVPQSAAFIVLT